MTEIFAAIIQFVSTPTFLGALIALVVVVIVWFLRNKKLMSNTVLGITKAIFLFVEQKIPNDTPNKKWAIVDSVLKKVTEEMSNYNDTLGTNDLLDMIKKYVQKEIEQAKSDKK